MLKAHQIKYFSLWKFYRAFPGCRTR